MSSRVFAGLARALTLLVLLGCGAGLSAQVVFEGDFAYTGDNGPAFWITINGACSPAPGSGRQSPIDIDHVVHDPRLEPLHVIASPGDATMTNPGYTLIGTMSSQATLTLEGVTYTLLQFHFHSLAEHTVVGRQGALELHAVYVDPTLQKFAVIAVLYHEGRPSRFLEKLIAPGLPKQTTSPPVVVPKVNIDEAYTDTSSYYTYAGSLTTPPCSENVRWLILKKWAEATPHQLKIFRDVLGNDFRPLQERNGRVIRSSGHRP